MRNVSGFFACIQPDCRTRDDFGALLESGDERAEDEPLTQRMAALVGARGQDRHPLTAGAFVLMVLLRRYSSSFNGSSSADCWRAQWWQRPGNFRAGVMGRDPRPSSVLKRDPPMQE